jgi:hypothetical protein
MQRKLSTILAAGILAGTLTMATAPGFAQNKAAQSKDDASSMPKVGDVAPDFKLKYFDGKGLKDVSLSEYRGKKNVIVAFYVFAFTGG